MKKTYDIERELILKFPKQEEKLKVLAFYMVLFQTFNTNNIEANLNRGSFVADFDYNRKLLLDRSENVFLPSLEQTLKYFDENTKIQYTDFHQFAQDYVQCVSQRFYMLSERYIAPFDGYSAQQLIEPVENSYLINEIDKLKTGFSLKSQLFLFIKNYLETIVAKTSMFNSNRTIINEITSLLSSEIVGNLHDILEQSVSKERTIDYGQILSSLELISSKCILAYLDRDSKMIYNFLPPELSGVVELGNESDRKLYTLFLSHSIALDDEKEQIQEDVKNSYEEFSDENLYRFINNIVRFSNNNLPKMGAFKKFVEERTSRKLIS